MFFDIDRVCPELRAIERHFDVIDAELRAVLPQLERIPRYQDQDPAQTAIADLGTGSWRTLLIHSRGGEAQFPNRHLCPRTTRLLASIPCVGQAFFSILEPGKSIREHEGPHHYYLRCHTAFRVPREHPPSLRVAEQTVHWREGESFLFDDSWNHAVENHSDEPRVVLVTDIVRPERPVRALYRLTHGLACLGISAARWREHYAAFDARSRLQAQPPDGAHGCRANGS